MHWRNNVIPNGHFHKDWQRFIKTWFKQPMKKKIRAKRRAAKVARNQIQTLKPIVTCPTMRYNIKKRLGRGFTIEELKAAGLNAKFARTIGIAVDLRRRNKSIESLQRNAQRLKEYKAKLILYPLNRKKPRKGDSTEEEIKLATTVKGKVMPLKRKRFVKAARVPTEAEKKFSAYMALSQGRADERLVGIRAKKAKEAAEALDAPKK